MAIFDFSTPVLLMPPRYSGPNCPTLHRCIFYPVSQSGSFFFFVFIFSTLRQALEVCNSADGHGTKSPLGYPPFQSVNFPFFVRRSLNRPPNRRQVSSLPRALTVSRWLSPSVSQLCLWRYLISPLPFFLCPLVTPTPIVPPCTAVFSTPYHRQKPRVQLGQNILSVENFSLQKYQSVEKFTAISYLINSSIDRFPKRKKKKKFVDVLFSLLFARNKFVDMYLLSFTRNTGEHMLQHKKKIVDVSFLLLFGRMLVNTCFFC
jgi:hypothetical protein